MPPYFPIYVTTYRIYLTPLFANFFWCTKFWKYQDWLTIGIPAKSIKWTTMVTSQHWNTRLTHKRWHLYHLVWSRIAQGEAKSPWLGCGEFFYMTDELLVTNLIFGWCKIRKFEHRHPLHLLVSSFYLEELISIMLYNLNNETFLFVSFSAGSMTTGWAHT